MCKYKKRNRDGGHDFLLNWNIGCTKHTADLALMASTLSSAFARKFYKQKVAFIQSISLEFYSI